MSHTTNSERIAAVLRAEMARRRITQGDLAEQFNWNAQTIGDRMRGRTPWRLDELSRIADHLGIPLTDLLDIDDEASA